MPDAMYENLKAKQAAGPEAGMMPPPAADAAMMDMGGMPPVGPEGVMPPVGPEGAMPIEEDMGELATEGRGGDVVMGHLTPGELVIPVAMMEDPEIARVLEDAFDSFEMDMDKYTVGHENNNVNPDTGYPEFYYDQHAANLITVYNAQVAQNAALKAGEDAWLRQWQQQEQTNITTKAYQHEAAQNRQASIDAGILRNQQQNMRLQIQQDAADKRQRDQQAESKRLAKERRTHEKVQAVKSERKRQAREKAKTFAYTAATAAAAHAPKKPRGAGVSRTSRRTAPPRIYSAPGTGAGGEGGRHTAMGRRPA